MTKSEVHNVDCLAFMKTLPDKCFQLAIADPPYGMDSSSSQGAGKLKGRALNQGNIKRWDKAPGIEFFRQLMRVSRDVIVWGGNYFPLRPSRCFICWDKMQPWPNFSQCEMAWTTFDKPAKLFQFDNRTGDKIHPTQKPVELYAYCLTHFAKIGGGIIFDPMMGSQSSRIAAYKMGFDYVGCELDKEYFTKGCERFERECLGVEKTKSGHTIVQTSLF